MIALGKADIDSQACLIQLLTLDISTCSQVAQQGGMAEKLPSDSHYRFPSAEDTMLFPHQTVRAQHPLKVALHRKLTIVPVLGSFQVKSRAAGIY